jgi:hypothetical protein
VGKVVARNCAGAILQPREAIWLWIGVQTASDRENNPLRSAAFDVAEPVRCAMGVHLGKTAMRQASPPFASRGKCPR